jgi:CheY-like chemotaxis protein
LTWLLVEDDTDIRNVVAVMISVWGEKPLSFADGNAAWAWLDSVADGTFTGELPELALMDIRMPGYSGDKVAARIRQTPPIKDIPIILMTAFSLSEAEIKVMMEQAGIDHLINKPLPDMLDFKAILYRVRDERRAKLAARPAAEGTVPAATVPAATVPAATVPAATSVPDSPSAQSQPAPAAPSPAAVPDQPATTPAEPAVPQPTQPQPTQPPQAESK